MIELVHYGVSQKSKMANKVGYGLKYVIYMNNPL